MLAFRELVILLAEYFPLASEVTDLTRYAITLKRFPWSGINSVKKAGFGTVFTFPDYSSGLVI